MQPPRIQHTPSFPNPQHMLHEHGRPYRTNLEDLSSKHLSHLCCLVKQGVSSLLFEVLPTDAPYLLFGYGHSSWLLRDEEWSSHRNQHRGYSQTVNQLIPLGIQQYAYFLLMTCLSALPRVWSSSLKQKVMAVGSP